jgi:hypothetical protein
MKTKSTTELLESLQRFATTLEGVAESDRRSELLGGLDRIISTLKDVRVALGSPGVTEEIAAVQPAFQQVISFLEASKSDAGLSALLAASIGRGKKVKRQPVQIPTDMSNEQIRALLQQELSISELRQIAKQRGVAVHKANASAIKKDVLANLERQEGYERLAASS